MKDIVIRPWGYYETIFSNGICWHKRIVVKPCESLSLQFHTYRSEYWFVESGSGSVQIGEDFYPAESGNTFYIPSGELHRIINSSRDQHFVIVEFAFGKVYESDIIRVEDNYGRAGTDFVHDNA